VEVVDTTYDLTCLQLSQGQTMWPTQWKRKWLEKQFYYFSLQWWWWSHFATTKVNRKLTYQKKAMLHRNNPTQETTVHK